MDILNYSEKILFSRLGLVNIKNDFVKGLNPTTPTLFCSNVLIRNALSTG